MKIDSVYIKNYKSLRNICLEGLGNLVILIGKNSSGKSNFLEILNRFFAEIDLSSVPSGIDDYFWFDGYTDEPIEISITLKLNDKECDEIFPSEILGFIKEKFAEKYQKLSICRQIIKSPTEWHLKSLTWADIPFYENRKPVTFEEFTKLLSAKQILLDELQAVFLFPGFSNSIIAGDFVFIKPFKKVYLMSSYAETLTRDRKIKYVNVSEKTTNWIKYAREYTREEDYTLVEEELRKDHLQSEISWLIPQLISKIVSTIITKLKNIFKLALSVRNSAPQNPFDRPHFLDSETQNRLRSLGLSDLRTEQKIWSKIEETFTEFTGYRLEPHHSYLRIKEGDLPLPIQYRGGGEQALLFLLRFLFEEKYILAIEEPELHTHPHLARQIFHVFKNFSKEKQIFITTHSTVFIDHADLDTTWVVRKEDKGTTIARIKDSEDLKILLFDLGVRPSDIFFSDVIIFVEGETEKVVLPILAEKIGINLRSPVISMIPIRGKNRGKYYLNVWIDVSKSANITYFFILDKDASEDKEFKEFVDRKILIENENFFILKKGSIEDYYSPDKLINAIQKEYEMELSEDDKRVISLFPRAKNIEKILKEKDKDPRSWKVKIGKRVTQDMNVNEIDHEIKLIFERLRTKIEGLR